MLTEHALQVYYTLKITVDALPIPFPGKTHNISMQQTTKISPLQYYYYARYMNTDMLRPRILPVYTFLQQSVTEKLCMYAVQCSNIIRL